MPIRQALSGWVRDIAGTRTYFRYLEREDRKRRVRAQMLAVAGAIATLGYIVWLATVLDLSAWWISIPFLAAEVAGLVIFISFTIVSWYPRYHSPTGVPVERTFTVDVFVTTCGEPFEMVATTLRAAVAIDYPEKTVYLLDDGGNAALRRLAGELGCPYLARQTVQDAKAGNLNFGLAHSSGDLVLTLDADQVPRPAMIRALIGYFQYPYIGFVQTKQEFDLPPGDPFSNSDPIFYNVMQTGKDNHNSAFSCGSGVLYRRAALQEIGGFSTWNVVEDVHTSMLLHDRGWRSVYHNHPLSTGTAPTTLWGVYRQRRQWATDSLRILFWDNPFRHSGLAVRQRFQYAHLGLVYLFAAFVMPVFFVIPCVSLFTGAFVIQTEFWRYVLFRLPSTLLTRYAFGYQYRAGDSPIPAGRAANTWLGYFPSFVYGTVLALGSPRRKSEYAVTRKAGQQETLGREVLGTAPQWAIIVLSLAAIPYGFVQGTGSVDLLIINSLWALSTVRKLSWVCRAPIESHRVLNGRRPSTA